MMKVKKEDYKRELFERLYTCEPKEFKIEKITLSNNHPIIQKAREWEKPDTYQRTKRFFGINLKVGWWY